MSCATGRSDHLGGNLTPDLFNSKMNASHDDILYAPPKTPEINVTCVQMYKDGESFEIFFQIMSQPLGYLIRFPLSIQLKSFQHWFKFLILSFSFTGGLFAYRDVPSVPSVPKVSSVVPVRKSALLYKKNIAPFAPTPRRAPIAKKKPFCSCGKTAKIT